MDIDEFLLARWTEREQTARLACNGTNGQWHVTNQERQIEADDFGKFVIYDEGGHNEHQAAHIALHDPAAVLADIAAKRAILAEHPQVAADRPHKDGPQTGCRTCHADTHCGEIEARGLCETVRHLATPDATHPDYNPDWSLS